MNEINKRIEALEAELQKLKNEVKPEFEVGKWYKLKESTGNAIACYQGIKSGFGISGEMWFNNDNWTFPDEPENWIPATHQEVEEALIKEAKKRGFKEGVRFKGALYGCDCVITTHDFNFRLDHAIDYKNVLFCNGNAIFNNGKWAEIVKDEPIKIGGRYEVVFMGKKGTSDILYTKIDGHDFLKEFWQSAKVISEHSKAKIMIGCSKQFDVSLETINQILEKL